MIYRLSFRGPNGAVKPYHLTAHDPAGNPVPSEFALASYERVIFLVHGFNVDEQSGTASLSRLAEILSLEFTDTAFVYVLWPGDSKIGPISYPFSEGHQANDTALELKRFMEAHVGETVPTHFISHSLGCRVVLETLEHLDTLTDSDATTYPVGEICFFAAAADDHSLSIPKRYKRAVERCGRVTVLSSTCDTVLKYLYPLGDLVQAFLFFWEEISGLALGLNGPKPVRSKRKAANKVRIKRVLHPVCENVLSIKIDKSKKVGHGDYLPPADGGKLNKGQKAATAVALAALKGQQEIGYS